MSALALPAALEAAAEGRMPDWARASAERRDHISRVAALMDAWAAALRLEERDRRRWRAAAWLHDALRDAPPREIRALVPEALRSLPGKLLHGPAAAARLRQDGVSDEPLLCAVAWHTLGHPDFDALGKALYLADFLEPGRGFAVAHCASMRERMPGALEDVLREVVAQRLHHALEMRHLLRPESVAFWNVLVEKA